MGGGGTFQRGSSTTTGTKGNFAPKAWKTFQSKCSLNWQVVELCGRLHFEGGGHCTPEGRCTCCVFVRHHWVLHQQSHSMQRQCQMLVGSRFIHLWEPFLNRFIRLLLQLEIKRREGIANQLSLCKDHLT